MLQFDPARVGSLSVARPGGNTEALCRSGKLGDWNIVLSVAGKGETTWPAHSESARSVLRILSNVVSTRAADPHSEFGGNAVTVLATLDDGSHASMRLDSRVLAGQVLARQEAPATGPPAWVDGALADMLVKAGPRDWRESALLADVTAEASRIALSGPSGSLSLARLQGRWTVREPVAAAAESDAIIHLTGALASVQVIDFLDGGAPAATGLDHPAATVILESDRRDPVTGQRQTITTRLRVGQQADLGGKGMFAAIERDGASERILVVSGAQLASISTDPAAYVSHVALGASPGSIGSAVVGERRYSRTLEGWSMASGKDEEQHPVSTHDAEALGAFLRWLTESRADQVRIDQAGKGAGPAVQVDIAGLDGGSLAKLSIEPGTSSDPGAPLIVRNGPVELSYPAQQAGAIRAWLTGP